MWFEPAGRRKSKDDGQRTTLNAQLLQKEPKEAKIDD